MDDDDSRRAFEAALSFIDEYEFEEHPPHAAHPLSPPVAVAAAPILSSHEVSKTFADVDVAGPLPLPLDALPSSPTATAASSESPSEQADEVSIIGSTPLSSPTQTSQSGTKPTAEAPLQPEAATIAASRPRTKAQTSNSGLSAEELQKKRRDERNARKRLLRKAGVYGDPNRARNERNREMAYLREKVGQLQGELRGLIASSGRSGQHAALLSTATPGQPGTDARADAHQRLILKRGASCLHEGECRVTKAPSVWQGVAARQRERRQKAERENVRLKAVLESQIKVAQGLQSLLQGSANHQMSELSSVESPKESKLRHGRTVDYLTDVEGFKDLLARIDRAYRDIDAVFDANGLSTMETTHHDVHVRQGADGMSVEIFANKVMPFEMRATGNVVWNHFEGPEKHRGNGSVYEKAAKHLQMPFTIVEDFSKELFAKSAHADVRMKQIVRRFVEGDREVVIRMMSATPIEITHKPFAGLTFHQCAYALVKRAAASTPGNEMSLLQLCTILSLDKEERTAGGPVSVRALTDFLLEYAAGNMRKHQELIENVLMDQALEERTHGAAL